MFELTLLPASVFGLSGLVLEVAGFLSPTRMLRRLFYALAFVLTVMATVTLIGHEFSAGAVLVSIVAVYRSINHLRVVSGRIKENRIRPVSRRSSVVLLGFQVLAIGIWQLLGYLDVNLAVVLYALSLSSLVMGLVFAQSVVRNLRRSSAHKSDKYSSDMDLPTVSVCVPARNETMDLPLVLESVLASDYPKLEVLVLDDCSHDKTSEIIKGFAQKGVRFIKGQEPKKDWLPKNQAYQALAEDASGELLLFLGVDVRLEPTTIRSLVGTLVARKKEMITVLPKTTENHEYAGLLQPMRYWWEVALPRRFFNRPPVLPTSWLISRQALFGLGEFKAVRSSVLPEGYFARELTKSDKYSFMRSDGKLDVDTSKEIAEQWDTTIRTRYPALRKRPENVMLVTLAELWFVVLPVALFILGFFTNLMWLWPITGVNFMLLFYVHWRIVMASSHHSAVLPLALFPIAVVIDIIGVQSSMWQYEFDEVVWKGRNVCIPVMKTYSRLPKV